MNFEIIHIKDWGIVEIEIHSFVAPGRDLIYPNQISPPDPGELDFNIINSKIYNEEDGELINIEIKNIPRWVYDYIEETIFDQFKNSNY